MPLLGHIIGGATFGLAARFWQLGILKRPMMDNPSGHVACMAFFGGAGYYWWQATVYMNGVLVEKEAELRVRRQLRQAASEKLLEQELNQAS
ncbi:hypothetical protein DFH07DRAFT_956934 [Mycena maculata]|uniref:Uncharacterized protein n=1 Tax=Mycena maculata TaxID=230809 RepID=A0AAD7JED4_9AGAR|nr:hypothetical protein DFH07DRAFT_956934 [Mycena maculata]